LEKEKGKKIINLFKLRWFKMCMIFPSPVRQNGVIFRVETTGFPGELVSAIGFSGDGDIGRLIPFRKGN
jgi:hypothetical protein